jgi:hypothetical protein
MIASYSGAFSPRVFVDRAEGWLGSAGRHRSSLGR